MTKIDEGVIKFKCNWEKKAPPKIPTELIEARNFAFQKKWIGWDKKHNVGYGNISLRYENSNQFFISGSQTGNIEIASADHFAFVEKFDIAKNEVFCYGMTKASSESLTHAALYLADNNIKAVLHIHNNELWKKIKFSIPTTPYNIPYGTPEMAKAIMDLFYKYNMKFKTIAMAGHEGGLISFGKNLQEAILKMEKLFEVL